MGSLKQGFLWTTGSSMTCEIVSEALLSQWKAAITSSSQSGIFDQDPELWSSLLPDRYSLQTKPLNPVPDGRNPQRAKMRGVIWQSYKGEQGMGWQRWSAEQASELIESRTTEQVLEETFSRRLLSGVNKVHDASQKRSVEQVLLGWCHAL